MGLFEMVLKALDADFHGVTPGGNPREEWQSGYHDGYADGRTGNPYGDPATNSDQARGGYAFGYSDGELSRQAREGPGWIW